MTLLLICNTPIIEQIFTLVSKKLNLELTIKDNTEVEGSYDLVVVDEEFINDKFNIIKQYTKRLGAISSEELSFDKSRDFIIPRPFLPTKLQELLKDEIADLKNSEEKEVNEQRENFFNNSNIQEDEYYEDDEVTIPVTDYVESLADDVVNNIEDENDESIVSLASLNEGGVLDGLELTKINQILKEGDIQDEVAMDSEDWKDINDIIDDALEEVKEYEFNLDNGQGKSEILPYKLVLSDYDIDELKPLLEKFNQEIVDKLSNGESVDVRLVLKDNI